MGRIKHLKMKISEKIEQRLNVIVASLHHHHHHNNFHHHNFSWSFTTRILVKKQNYQKTNLDGNVAVPKIFL